MNWLEKLCNSGHKPTMSHVKLITVRPKSLDLCPPFGGAERWEDHQEKTPEHSSTWSQLITQLSVPWIMGPAKAQHGEGSQRGDEQRGAWSYYFFPGITSYLQIFNIWVQRCDRQTDVFTQLKTGQTWDCAALQGFWMVNSISSHLSGLLRVAGLHLDLWPCREGWNSQAEALLPDQRLY